MNKQNHGLNFSLNNQAKVRLAINMALLQALATPCTLYALPDGADIQFGQSTLQVKGNELSINQTTRQSIINWQSFGIAANESVKLMQPAQGTALFRVVGSGSSQIFGHLSATGSLFLINPNGILFGQGSQVDVGSLVASSMNMSNSDFLSKNYQLNANGSTGSVTNQGAIKVADGGYLVLLGNEVKNSGTLTANNGSVVMGSAQSAVLDFYGNGLVKARLSGDALNALVEQAGVIQADGGTVQLATNSRSSAVNVTGLVQADSLVERNGVIRLEGGNNAKVTVAGTLSAAGNQTGTKGGNIEVSGEQVALFSGAKLDASGNAGGGEILVGGDYQGKNTQVQNARTTYVDKDATITVDAKLEGNGGKAIVWADDITRYYGSISAKGGSNEGNGGFVEVSGKQNLDFSGGVDVSAPKGMGGLVLLDPKDIVLNATMQTSPPNNANGTADVAFGDAPAAGATTIQIADITGYSELFLQATNNITVASTLTMAANNSIRLEANNNIAINGAVTVSGTGNINFKADADSSGAGNLAIGANITAQAGGIDLSGATISRTAGNIASTGAANSNAGNINISATGTANLGAAAITANGGTASAGNAGKNGGAITIAGSTVTTTGTKTASGSNSNGAAQAGGNAGSVTISSTDGMSVGTITSSGGNGGSGIANGGNAGSITLTNSTTGNILAGALTARTGNAIGTGAGGTVGAINVTNNASGTLTTGALSTAGGSNGNGGVISLTTASGNLTTTSITSSGGTALTGTAGRNAAAITINSGGSVSATTIAANGSVGVGTSQNGGNAANITITGNTGVTTSTVAASGGGATATNGNGGNAGNINISNNVSGNIVTTTLTASAGNATGTGGAAAAIVVNNAGATGNITTGAISTLGGIKSAGGNVTLTSAGNLATGTITTSGGTTITGNAGQNAGAITINSGGSVTTTSITASGSSGLGTNQNGGNAADITITGNTGVTTSTVTASGGNATATNGNGGNAGNINISNNLTGNIVTTTLTARNGNAAGTGTGGAAAAIVVNNAGTTGNINTGAITTQGATKGAGGNVTLTSTGNLIAGTITTSGGTTVTGNAGRNAGAITIDSAGNTTVSTIAAAGSTGVGTNQNGGNGGTVSLSAGGAGNTITMASVTTTGGNRTGTGIAGTGGNLTVADAALLSANTTIATTGGSGIGSGGAVSFDSTINSSGVNRTLSINSNAATTFGGTVGNTLALASLTTNSGGTTAINGGSVTTTGAQAYGDNVTLGAPTTLTTTNGNVTFSAITNANGNAVNISAGTGAVSATNAANNFSELAITAASANIRDANAIVLGATNVTGAYNLQTAGAVTQSAAVTVNGATTLAAGSANDITLNNAGNNFNSVAITNGRNVSLVDANALTIGASSVKTINAKTLSNDLKLGSNITASGSGNSILLASAQNFLNPGNFSLTPGAGRWLVYSTTPASDTRGAGLLTSYNFKQYNTTLADPVLGTGNGFIYSTPAVITTSLGGTASKVYDGTTAASIGSLTLGKSGMIDGDTVNISALTGATYDNKNVGVNKTVSSNTLTITGATNGAKQVFGYELANSGVATGAVGAVTQRGITVTAATDAKTYDGNTSSVAAPTVTTGTVVAGDAGSFSQAYDNRNAGTGKVLTATGSVADGNGGNNYAVTFVADNTGVITQRDITAVTGITASNKTYDGNTSAPLDTSNASFSGIVLGETLTVGTAIGTFNSKDVITANTVNINGITLADGTGQAGNYNLTNNTASTTANVTARPITVTANPGQNKSIGATEPLPYTYTVTGLGLVGGDTLSGVLNRLPGETAGNYAINQGSLDAGSNYSISYVSNLFVILARSTSPSDAAGLGNVLLAANERQNQNLAILNVSETAAGNNAATDLNAENSIEECKANNPSINNPTTSIMFNFGIKLPAGVKPVCI